jgi:hypothetical protein
MRFEKIFKSYSNDQWLLCREQTWFNMVDILHALILNKKIIDEMIFNYTEKPISERLSQTTNDFSNI